MGKTKQGTGSNGNRVKGNAKAGSSTDAANVVGFGSQYTFDSLRSTTSVSSTSPEKTEQHSVFLFSDPNVDHHLKVILKRMQKKDPVTKQKAIADFLELNDAEMLVPLLPHWPRMYKSLAIDTDRKVRDLGHKAWQHIALLCKKEVVPFLKAIAPFWILGTCDIYDETAKSALIALNKIFEEKDKRKKFFKHVAADVIETLFNFVITETKESLTSMVGIPSEWTAADYEKHLESYFCSVQGSALKAMTLVLDVVGPEFDGHYQFINDVIYPCNTIWKFARSNTSDLPRAGFLNFLASSVKCVEKFGNLEKYKKHFTKFVLSQLNTEDTLVIPALLKIIPKILHLYSEAELKKSYVPSLKFFFFERWIRFYQKH
jgi:hypothetical protein